MKKSLILTLGLFVALVGFMSCGNSAEQEAREKAIKDSLYNDSIMKAQAAAHLADSLHQDSLAKAALEQALLDSLREDSIMKASGKKGGSGKKPVVKPAPAPAPTPTETPKTGKDAIKGGSTAPVSGKDALKGGSTTPPSGKDALKNK